MQIVGVKFQSKYKQNEFYGREYSYYADDEVKDGDKVKVATRNGEGLALVTRADIDEKEISEAIKPLMKTITKEAVLKEEDYGINNIQPKE